MSKSFTQKRCARRSGRTLMRSASLVALSLATLSGMSFAQEEDVVEEEEAVQDTVVVTGIRGALKSAQDLKQDADVFVDAITATDIGALPDRSVSEALQRVPGVTVERFAGPNDPDHFAVEGSGVIVRGLPFVRSELNGRDVFAANSSGVLGFEDVSPELLGSVQVFKNQSADMIEGGIAGSVNLVTRKPFDSADRQLAFSVEATYSDFIEKTTPSFSALWSDQWETEAGRFGLLASFAHSELKSRADTPQTADFRERTDLIPGQTVYVPSGGGIRTQEFDRERDAIALAGQWESLDGTMLATAQFLQSDADLVWGERVLESSIDDNPAIQALAGTEFEFGSDGVLSRGVVSETAGWRGNDNTLPLNGVRQLNLARERAENDKTSDLGFNFKWTPTDQWSLNFDAQVVDSETTVRDVTAHGAFFANVGFDFVDEGVSVAYFVPQGEADNYFQDSAEYYWRSIMDHAQDSKADSVAFQGDAEYDFGGDGFLKSVRFGARYSDRDSDLKYSNFNWGNVSEIWTGSPNNLLTLEEANVLSPGLFQAFDFDNYARGAAPISGVPFYSGPLAEDYEGFVATVQPILAAQGSFAQTLGQRSGVVDGGLYLPGEIVEIDQETTAIYGRADFEFVDFLSPGFVLDGNIGLRYVETDVSTAGQTSIQNTLGTFGAADLVGTCAAVVPGGPSPDFCTLSATDLQNFQTFFGTEDTVIAQNFTNSYEDLLPSLNLRLDIGDGRQFRFGVSQALVRPQAFDLRSSGTLSEALSAPGEFGGIELVSGNPNLKPITATQIDLSYEWYFADTGSLTVSYFYKDLEDYWVGSAGNPGQSIVSGGVAGVETFTNNGATIDVSRRSIVNAEESASLSGFEIAYQQFYDMLPAPFDGLGIQANYTYIDAQGIGDLDNTGQGRFARDATAFERVSEHQYNLVGLYEKGPYQARLAWNWRDDFLLTKRDVIFPFASIYQEATGQLDASFFYDINDTFKVGIQGVNLLNDITETTQTINDNGLRAPRSFNQNDRRFSLILRGNF
ncbi:MAG: TonB-dependent receptor [Henriciella sp.]|nr:TonB-dependent receptor [Henriciella sp.]